MELVWQHKARSAVQLAGVPSHNERYGRTAGRIAAGCLEFVFDFGAVFSSIVFAFFVFCFQTERYGRPVGCIAAGSLELVFDFGIGFSSFVSMMIQPRLDPAELLRDVAVQPPGSTWECWLSRSFSSGLRMNARRCLLNSVTNLIFNVVTHLAIKCLNY